MKIKHTLLMMLAVFLASVPDAALAQTPPDGCIPCDGVVFTVHASDTGVTPPPTGTTTPTATASGQIIPTQMPSITGSLRGTDVAVPQSGVETPLIIIAMAAVALFSLGFFSLLLDK